MKRVLILCLLISSFAFAESNQKDSRFISWHNFKTETKEYFEGFPPVKRIKEFIPQTIESQCLYAYFVQTNNTPSESMVLVLKTINDDFLSFKKKSQQ